MKYILFSIYILGALVLAGMAVVSAMNASQMTGSQSALNFLGGLVFLGCAYWSYRAGLKDLKAPPIWRTGLVHSTKPPRAKVNLTPASAEDSDAITRHIASLEAAGLLRPAEVEANQLSDLWSHDPEFPPEIYDTLFLLSRTHKDLAKVALYADWVEKFAPDYLKVVSDFARLTAQDADLLNPLITEGSSPSITFTLKGQTETIALAAQSKSISINLFEELAKVFANQDAQTQVYLLQSDGVIGICCVSPPEAQKLRAIFDGKVAMAALADV